MIANLLLGAIAATLVPMGGMDGGIETSVLTPRGQPHSMFQRCQNSHNYVGQHAHGSTYSQKIAC